MSERRYRIVTGSPVYEDSLPDDMTDADYAAWFQESWVDGVRVGPPVERTDDTTTGVSNADT